MSINVLEQILQVVFLVMSVVIHEVSHGYAAYLMGDKTAFYAKRLTLNPIRHIDLFGSIILPLLLIITKAGFVLGWAKPVPYNPYNLSNQKWGGALVALAGPVSNFILAGVFVVLIKLGAGGILPISQDMAYFFSIIVLINLVLGLFNLVPIPPLDGSKIIMPFVPYQYAHIVHNLERYGFIFAMLFIVLLWGPFSTLVMWIFEKLIT